MKGLLVVIFLAAQVCGVHAAKQYRDFMDTKGRTIRGCVQAFDKRTGTVTFERDNHRTSKVPITIFSDADQNYIKEWECSKQFLSDTKFKISAQRKKAKDKDASYSSSITSEKVELMGYEVVLENCSATPLKNIEVEYCIYYEQDEIRKHKQYVAEGVFCGSFPRGTFPPKTKMEKMTKTVKIYKKELDSGWIYTSDIKNVQKGRVRGIWIRVYMNLSSGEKLTRNYCLPDSLNNSKAWMRSSVNVGMN